MIDKLVASKKAKEYAVKTNRANNIKAVNMGERTIDAIANTYYFVDSDMDVLVMGAAAKSIKDRGPQSNATAKIKHQLDHQLNVKNVLGRITELKEEVLDGKSVLSFSSYIPETTSGNEHLINYQEGLYDNHSIGFRYQNIEYAERDSSNDKDKKNWDEIYPMLLNPEVADEAGYFFVVREIKLYEISTVSFGANSLTPYLGSKAEGQEERLKQDIIGRIDQLKEQFKEGLGKSDRNQMDLQAAQLKQIIKDLQLKQPSKKDTFKKPSNNDTAESNSMSILWAK